MKGGDVIWLSEDAGLSVEGGAVECAVVGVVVVSAVVVSVSGSECDDLSGPVRQSRECISVREVQSLP